jgi:hypothetical protein
MLARASMSVSRLSAVPAPRLAVAAAAFSSPAEDAAKKMNFGVKSAKAPGATKENNVKHFKIYRWNPDTKGAANADRRAGRADGRTEQIRAALGTETTVADASYGCAS